MRLSLEWLREWAGEEWQEQRLAETLTALGLEVEGSDGQAIEVKVTADRGDCLSVLGIAQELRAKKGEALPSLPELDYPELKDKLAIERQSAQDCGRYSLCLVDNVRPAAAPDYVQKRLWQCGLKSHNAVVDATNYVALLLGQPLHAFDLDRLGKKIIVRRAIEGERFLSLEGKTYALTEDDLVIANEKGPVALAGVIGGMDASYRQDTKRVLIEAAHFSPALVRSMSRHHGIRTESSYRFERYVDPEKTLKGALLCALFIHQWTGAHVLGWQDSREPPKKMEIRTSLRKMEKILGAKLKRENALSIFQRLGVQVRENEGELLLTPPSSRPDLKAAEDLAEEVARVQGYGSFSASLPTVSIRSGKRSRNLALINRAQNHFVKAGLQEIHTHTFCSEDQLQAFGFDPSKVLAVRNPLTRDTAFLRPSLLPGMVKACEHNLNAGARTTMFFEIGKIFDGNRQESWSVGFLFYGDLLVSGLRKEKQAFRITFYDARELLASLFSDPHIPRFSPMAVPYLKEGRALKVSLGEVKGIFGEARQEGLFLAELPLEAFSFLLESRFAFQPPPKYPVVERDLALVCPVSLRAAEVAELIWQNTQGLLKSLDIFDLYRGSPLKETEKSIGFHLVYQAPDRTLRDEEVDAIERHIMQVLRTRGVYLRPG